MKGELSDGASYRVIRCGDADNARIHALSHAAFRVRIVLRLSLPPTGLGAVYAGALSDQCGMSRDDVLAALAELEAAGFVRRNGLHVLLVDAFGSEPNLNPNDQKHHKFIRRLLAAVGDSPLVADFQEANPQWFPETLGRVSEDPSKPAAVAEPASVAASAATAATAIVAEPASAAVESAGGLAGDAIAGNDENENSGDASPDGAHAFQAAVLVEFANKAMEKRWGAEHRPITAGAAATRRAIEALIAKGIDTRFATRDIVRQCLSDRDARTGPPRSLMYFVPGIVERWDAREIVPSTVDGTGEKSYRAGRAAFGQGGADPEIWKQAAAEIDARDRKSTRSG